MQSREIRQPSQPMMVRKQNRKLLDLPTQHNLTPPSRPSLTVGVAGVDGGRFRPSLDPIPRAKEGSHLPPPTIMVRVSLGGLCAPPLFSGRPLATREAVGEVDRNDGWRDY